MNMKTSISIRSGAQVFLSLALASGIGVGLFVIRFVASHQLAYRNLVWNLFLAWLPLGFAFLADRFRASRGGFVA